MTTERRIPVKTYIVRLFCDCGGEMEPTGVALTSHPPRYPHRCTVCGTETSHHTRTFPFVNYDWDERNEATTSLEETP